MEILITITEKIAEYIVVPIGRQVGYLLFYKDNFKKLKDEVEKLMTIKERIKHDVEAERRNGREIEVDVQNWMNIVDETLKEAKQLFEDPCRVTVRCSIWSFLNLKSRYQLSRNAKKMTKEVIEVQEKGKFDPVGYPPLLRTTNFIFVAKDIEKLESRSLMKEDIVLALRDPKVSKVRVFGLSGVGKTILVKEVAKQVMDDNLFDVVVMATISQTPNFEKIQREIADQLGLHFEETTTIGRAGRLCERIKMEKMIIIILDDIWTKIDLDKLGIPLKEGCKLLLTSTKQDILQKMETHKDFRLEVLDDVESWSLFQVKVGNAVKDVNLRNIATQVAQRCAGLPVLIVTMANSLKNRNIHYWKDTLNKLKRVDIGEMDEKVYSVLEITYNQLEDNEMKEVFLLCGLYGTPIFVGDLLKYVFGLGVFKYINTIEDARNRLYKIIGDLKASCLLLDDGASAIVNMHDIICKVAISIASRDQYVFTMKRSARLKDWPSVDFLERCTQIILMHCGIQKLPEKLNCPNLKFLFLDSLGNRTLEIPNSFFEGTRNLEVLDLTGMIISSLPTSLVFLTKLKTLCLDQCSLKDMVGIGALKNLEILSFIHSSMEEFPSEIRQLTHLRMLDLRASGIEVILPNIVSKLTKLEELYIGDTSIKWEVESSTKQNKNATLAELRHLTSLTTLEFQICEAWVLPRDIMFEKLERYKIVIGDKWEWLDKNGASRLLKLKLNTNIHLEHGIKTLIKRVEDLYLDEINGISNVLFQLNGEGFPLLKHLHIQNNGEIQHIINSIDRNLTNILFPKLETLILHNLNKLEKICHGPLTVDSFGKLKVFQVKSCGQLKYIFLVSMVKEFCQLVEIEVSECPSMKNIVFMENIDSGITTNKIEFIPLRSLTLQHLPAMDGFCSNIPTLFLDAKVSLPNLETLKLSSINLNKIWEDDQHSAAKSFQNLANLIVEDCGSLKYLFSPFMVENLKNLKRLEISKCHMMEEIIATEGRNNEIASEEVRFSKLKEIIINDMKNLKTAWHYQFDRVKTLEVNECEKLESIFPSSSMQNVFGSLEILKVSHCALVEEIFQLTANGMNIEEVTTQLKNLVLRGLPKMKQIWSRDPQGILRFFNLQVVQIKDCKNLEYLFPFSIAKDLPQLERLELDSCGIKEVVSKRDGPMEESAIFELNHLTSLNLIHLHELRGFYARAHTLECQSLKRLHVFCCKGLKLFDIQSSRCQESSTDDQLHFSMPQPLFTVEEVIGNLEELALNSGDANMMLQQQVPWHLFCKLKRLKIFDFEDDKATFPHCFLKNVPNLKSLVVGRSSFKEIFYDETLTDKEGWNEISTRLKQLVLCNLPKLEDICREGCLIHPVLEVLEILHVEECSSLRNLVPSSATFCHLTDLEITNCNGLLNFITSSTARSLVKLEKMKLRECNSLEEIVTEEVDETKNEIAFNSLLILVLDYLPRLYSFSSSKCSLKFPLLKIVVVRQCPRMKIFSTKATSTPKLKKVLIEEKGDGECYWEGDLNGTINKMFLNKFCSFEHLELSEYSGLRELWYGQVEHKLFCNLKSLVVQNCYWLSNILLSLNILQTLSNLEVVEVRDCDTLEAVFDLGDINERAMEVKETIQLKKITLCNLPKLKYIWKHDFHEIVSFGNSGDVHGGECQALKMSEAPGNENKGEKVAFRSFEHLKLISSNLLQLLQSMEELEVRDCDSLEAVFDVKVLDDKEMHIKEASQLKKLALSGLPNLKHIWNEDSQEILSFKNLQVLRIAGCQNLKNLFSVSLCLDLQQLEELSIKFCGVEEIVATEEEGLEELKFNFPRLTIFTLICLTQLKSFYPERHTLECPSLKTLNVYGCEMLQIFAFSHLGSQQTLRVDEIDKPIQQTLFSLEKVPPNLKELALNEKDYVRILNGHHEANLFHSIEMLCLQCFQETPIMFLDSFFERFPNTTTLGARCSSFEVLFPSEGIDYCGIKSPILIKDLWLCHLDRLKHIWNDDFVSDVLEHLRVLDCPSLTCLGPPSISFASITILEVEHCKALTFIMTPPTAKSLVHLEALRVTNCEMMEEVVMIDEGIPEEITFESLQYLEMASLPCFKSFCSGKHTFVFPSLENLIVTGCPKMQNFSSGVIIAPKLAAVEVENERRYWTEDLNTTIKQLVMEKEVSNSDQS